MKNFRTIFLYILFVFLAKQLSAQTDTTKIEKPKVDQKTPQKDSSLNSIGSFNIHYGYKFFVHDFQNKFNTIAAQNYHLPVQFITIGPSGPGIINRYPKSYYMHFLYSQVIPQTLHINDSILCKVTGGIFSIAWGGYINSRSEKLFLGYYLGFNTGRLRFYGNELVRQKNPFFSPKIGIQPKFFLGKFTISIIAEAESDISKVNWRRTALAKKNGITIDRFNQSGFTIMAGLSYRFIYYSQSSNNDESE